MPVANVWSMTVAAHLFDVSEVTRATTLRGDRIQGLNLRVDVLDGKVGRLALASQLASRDNKYYGGRPSTPSATAAQIARSGLAMLAPEAHRTTRQPAVEPST
jgi:hypothetical protein